MHSEEYREWEDMNADQCFPQILKSSAKIVKPVLQNQAHIQASLEIVLQKKKKIFCGFV